METPIMGTQNRRLFTRHTKSGPKTKRRLTSCLVEYGTVNVT